MKYEHNKSFLFSIGVTVVLTALIGFWAHQRVKQESEKLEASKEELIKLRSGYEMLSLSNATLRSSSQTSHEQLSELMKLRADVGRLRNENKRLERSLEAALRQTNEPAVAVVPTTPLPVSLSRDLWAFSGYNTPRDALVSTFWAMKNGDVNTFLNSLTPEAEASMRKQFANLSDAEIARALEAEINGLNSLRLDRTKNVTDTSVGFVLRSEETDDGATRTREEAVITLTNVLGQWKLNGF